MPLTLIDDIAESSAAAPMPPPPGDPDVDAIVPFALGADSCLAITGVSDKAADVVHTSLSAKAILGETGRPI